MATEDSNTFREYYLDRQLSLWVHDTRTDHWFCVIDYHKETPEVWGPMEKLIRESEIPEPEPAPAPDPPKYTVGGSIAPGTFTTSSPPASGSGSTITTGSGTYTINMAGGSVSPELLELLTGSKEIAGRIQS